MIQKNTGYIKADIDNNFEELFKSYHFHCKHSKYGSSCFKAV